MKKTLFSLAFVAASGAYVATANHMFGPPGAVSPAVAMDTAVPVDTTAPVESLSSSTPPASAVPLVTSSAPVTPEVPKIVARAEPVAPPPLPRPRPATPAVPVTIKPAASTDTAVAATSGYRDGTYTGSDENAYYGRVQVQVTVTNHQIASVRVLDYPQDRRTSRYINSQALPLLKQEVIAADSSRVDTISGATLTSNAYIRSLGSALAQAGAASA